jgi:site-specific DNA recombinase
LIKRTSEKGISCLGLHCIRAHEGWKLIRTAYDDGGFSGDSMERSALQRLLEEKL